MGIPQSPFKNDCYAFGHTFADLGQEMHEDLHRLTSLHDLARMVISVQPLLLPADARASLKDVLAEMSKEKSIANPMQFLHVILDKWISPQEDIDAPLYTCNYIQHKPGFTKLRSQLFFAPRNDAYRIGQITSLNWPNHFFVNKAYFQLLVLMIVFSIAIFEYF